MDAAQSPPPRSSRTRISPPPSTHPPPYPSLWQVTFQTQSDPVPPCEWNHFRFLTQVLCTRAHTHTLHACTHMYAYSACMHIHTHACYSHMHRVANTEQISGISGFSLKKQVQQPWTCMSPWQPCRSPCGGPGGSVTHCPWVWKVISRGSPPSTAAVSPQPN